MAEDDAAERAHDEADAERGEGDQRARARGGVEEQVAEHQRGGRAVDEEVVPLERRADRGAGDHPLAATPGSAGGFCPSRMNRLMLVLLPSGPRAPTTWRPGSGPLPARVARACVVRSRPGRGRRRSRGPAWCRPARRRTPLPRPRSPVCEGARVERDQHRAVRRVALLAEHAGPCERPADELDHHAQPGALVRAERQQRAAGVEVGRVARGLAAARRRARRRGTCSPRASATASLPSGIVAVDQSMTSGGLPGVAHAIGLVPSRRSLPPNGATVGSALQKAIATRPSSASCSTHSPRRPTWLARRIAAAAAPCSRVTLGELRRPPAGPRAGRSRRGRRRSRPRRGARRPPARPSGRSWPSRIELQVRDEPADAVRVVSAQVRLHQRLGDHGGGRRRCPGVLEDGAGEVQQLPCAVHAFHVTERDSLRWKSGRCIPAMDGGKPDVLVLGEVLVELTAPVPLREADTLRLSCSGDALERRRRGGRGRRVGRAGDRGRRRRAGRADPRVRRARAGSTRRTCGGGPSRTASTSRARAASSSTRGEAAPARRSGPRTWLRAPLARGRRGRGQRHHAGAVGVVRGGGRRRGRRPPAATSSTTRTSAARLTTAGEARAALERVAPHAALVTPSCPDDTRALLGTADPAAAAAASARAGRGRGRGHDGRPRPLRRRRRRAAARSRPRRPPQVVDATGAGDVLAGTAAARLALGDDLLAALRRATAAAARSLAGPGGTGWLPAAA